MGGVTPATTFLKDYNLDPETRLSGVIAVVGGGSTAMDAARSALRAGASEVHLVYRRTQAEMPAQKEEVRAALAEGIQLHELAAPVADPWRRPCARTALPAHDAQRARRAGRRRLSPLPGGLEFALP